MEKARVLAGFLLLGAWAAGASATTSIYTDRAQFEALLQPDFYLNQFEGYLYNDPLNGVNPTPLAGDLFVDYAANGYSYTLVAVRPSGAIGLGLVSLDNAVATNASEDRIVAFFTGRPVYAVGGNFFGRNLYGEFYQSIVQVSLSDGTVYTYTNTGFADSFVGFISTVPIVTLVEDTGPTGHAPALTNYYVGAPIPEPLTLTASGLAIGALGVHLRRRFRRQAA